MHGQQNIKIYTVRSLQRHMSGPLLLLDSHILINLFDSKNYDAA